MPEIECKQCGSCCYLELFGERKKCIYLEFKDGKAFCPVYETRLGRYIGSIQSFHFECMLRSEQMKQALVWKKPKAIKGCPYG